MAERTLDVIGLGRAGVDFYGEQLGGRLEDMASFAKYAGGSPANTIIGAEFARKASIASSGQGEWPGPILSFLISLAGLSRL